MSTNIRPISLTEQIFHHKNKENEKVNLSAEMKVAIP